MKETTKKERYIKTAKKFGYNLVTGAYHGTSDDRADRYYLDEADSAILDRRGGGIGPVDLPDDHPEWDYLLSMLTCQK